MKPLIITSADPRLPESPNEEEQIIEEAKLAFAAGAAIIHLHLIFKPPVPGQFLEFDIERSKTVVAAVRKECPGAIIQVGKTTATNASRIAFCDEVDIDMLSMTLSDNDKYASGGIPASHRDRSEFADMAQYCLEHDILPELEVFHAGAIWNMRWMIREGLLKAPYWANICMYHEGGGWTPRTREEIDYRVGLLPEESNWHLTVFAHQPKDFVIETTTPDEHTRLLAYAILKGGHIRTGREDRPQFQPGEPVKNNAQLVSMMADISRSLGRPVATPEQAREIIGLKPYSA